MRLNRRHVARAGAAVALLAAPAIRSALAQPAEQQAVAHAVDALTKAMLDVDRPKLEALTADQLSYGHSAGRIETKKQFVENLESRSAAFRRIELGDQTIALVDNEAIVRHLFTGETISPSGQVTPVKIGVLQIWQKQGSDWKLLARQAYRI
jgi:hypothetical protein